MKHPVIFLVILSCIVGGMNSCKKGCTNANARNYDSSAKEEDASCLFCDSIAIRDYDDFRDNKDTRSVSPHYNQQVLRTSAYGHIYQYKGNGCKVLGLGTTCPDSLNTGENSTTVKIRFINLITDTLFVTGQFRLTMSGNLPIYININNYKIAPGDTAFYSESYSYSCFFSSSFPGSFSSYSSLTFNYK